jgi:hypothetical protein
MSSLAAFRNGEGSCEISGIIGPAYGYSGPVIINLDIRCFIKALAIDRDLSSGDSRF